MWEFAILVVITVLVFWLKNDMQSSFFKLSQQLEELKRELKRIKEEKPATVEKEFKAPSAAQPSIVTPPPPVTKTKEEKGTDVRPIIMSEELGIPNVKPKVEEEKKQEEKISLGEKLGEFETALHIEAPPSMETKTAATGMAAKIKKLFRATSRHGKIYW